jgi:hypothetical protein
VDSYKQTHVWKESLRLSRRLYSLSDDLPEDEQSNLGAGLRDLAGRIPGEIAIDLVKGDQPRMDYVLRVASLLELIDQVYPALDTSSVQKLADSVLERMQSTENFQEAASATVKVENE